MTGRWVDALDAYEARLAAQRQALAEGTIEPAAWQPPTDLGPLPESLTARARELQRSSEELVAALLEAKARCGRDLAATRRAARRAAVPTPRYVDRSA